MNPHTDVDNFDDPVDQPDNSDLVTPAAATLNVPTSGALNRTRWLKNRLGMSDYDIVLAPSANRINQMNWTGPGWLQTTGTVAPFAYVPIRAHRGATLDKVTLKFKIPVGHGALPAVLPKLSVARGDMSGVAATLNSGDAGSGLVIASNASVAAYEAGGAVQAFTYTCNQNALIDTALYFYALAIFDESGANAIAANLFYGATLSWKLIPDARGA